MARTLLELDRLEPAIWPRTVRRLLAGGAAFCALASVLEASAQAPAPTWAELLKRDARALHDTYADSHPGAVDPENPGFRKQLAAGLERANDRAVVVNSYGGYLWGMREYVASFNDGHVAMDATPSAPGVEAKWPGFFTREVDGRHVVAARADLASLPPLGASLKSCDGIDAEELAAQLVGQFRGRWNMGSQRDNHAWRLFLDAENPFIKMPSSCTFSVGDSERAYPLAWSSLSNEALALESRKVSGALRPPTGVRRFGTRGVWVSDGSFSGDASTADGKAIISLIKTLEKQRAVLASADRIVLDVRRNNGGSSRWGNEIAALVWGKKVAEAARPQSAGVDWQVARANKAAVQQEAKNPDHGFLARMYMSLVASGMSKALAAGQPLWREKVPPTKLAAASFAGPKPDGRAGRKVYILADSGCGSACLDAMDVWTRAGAIPIGRETAADTLYMEIREQSLPSGLVEIWVPMKVYRGRPRGHNIPYKPVHPFDGDMGDQAAVEAWVAGLP